jgi:hypothetical protein
MWKIGLTINFSSVSEGATFMIITEEAPVMFPHFSK